MKKLARPLTSLLAVLASVAVAACDRPTTLPLEPDPKPREPAASIDVAAHAPEAYGLEAVATDSATGDVLALAAGVGVLRLDDQGELLSLTAFGEAPLLPDYGFGDLDVLPDGRWVLAAPQMAMAFDPETGELTDYFCLEPGFGEIIMRNSAVTVDEPGGRILAAPTYYDTSVSWDEPSDAFVVEYGFDGTFRRQFDVLGTGIVAEGLAVADDGSVYAVDGQRLSVFDAQGVLVRSQDLGGVEDASGLALDAEHDRLLVSDRANLTVVAFPLTE